MAISPDNVREPCGLGYVQLSKLTDELIMAHLAAGHGDAVAVLLDRYSRLVLSVASKIIRNPTEAEDVTQDVFVDLCRTAAQFDSAKGTAKMWIVRTAYRRSLTRRRKLMLRSWQDQGDFEEGLNVPSDADLTLGSRLSPFESQRLVRQILGKIDARQRRVLELVFFEGLTMWEVAAKTGANHAVVRHRYYRGIDKLRELMAQVVTRERASQRQEQVDAEA